MQFTVRPYASHNDFRRLTTFLAQCRSNIDHAHYLHIGDLVWQVFHMLAEYQPSDILHLWEDEQQNLVGFVLVYPPFGMFDLQLLPTYSGSTVEAHMLTWVQNYFEVKRQQATSGDLYTLVHERDTQRIVLLEANGFVRGAPWLYLQRSLAESLPEYPTIEGFTIRSVIGEVEAGERATVLAATFGAPVFAERYRQFMHAPSYIPELDVIAVAPNGQFGAFAMCWVDTISKVGQFEPVGTAPDFRRRGLGHAVLHEGVRRMAAHGAEQVIVIVEAAEQAAVELYTSIGLERCWNIYLYSKQG
jgi:mycothiol synthase